ncbi:unnamed protein product [Caenorhabditis sp. 36 PRJEB53466]|nr:unnamed protein product [Caenorhabditis sp. 36 PRJEB53466]
MNETDCPTCKFPTTKTRENRLSEACQFIVPRLSNTLIVPNYGQISVVKGDLSWLSPEVSAFLNECVSLMTPSAVRLCNGSVFEAQELREAIENEFRTEEQKQLDRLHLTVSDIGYDDVHVVTKDRVDAEPGCSPSSDGSTRSDSSENVDGVRLSAHFMSVNHFEFAKEQRFDSCMTGRMMYVIPFAMGLIGSGHAVYGVQITDDPVLVLHLRSTFRVLSSIWDLIASTTNFIRSVHSIGMPHPIIRNISKAKPSENTAVGSFVVLKHDDQQVWAHGNSFGRNFRFGTTFAVHAASWIGVKRGWLAESASILSITNPQNQTIHVCYSSLTNFQSLALQTGLAKGWKVEIVSNKTVWLHWHEGKLHAIAPENDEMSEMSTAQNLRQLLSGSAANYQIQGLNPQNSKWNSEFGVPISAYIFANRRCDQFPLILEANSWQDGVVLAAGIRISYPKKQTDSVSSDSSRGRKTRNILVECPMLRTDPINFSFAKYVNHWLQMGITVKATSAEKSEPETRRPPPIFFTNLSQEIDRNVIWPGGVDNARIFEYIFKRCTNPTDLSNTTSSGLGKVPKSLELNALVNMPALLQIDIRFWLQELSKLRTFFHTQMGSCLPAQLDKALTDMAAAI